MRENETYWHSPETLEKELKILLQDPAFKDRVLAVLKQLEPEKGRELAKVLLWSDSVFSFGLAGQIPLCLNFLVAFIDQLGKELQSVPPELIRAFTTEMANNFDREAIKTLPRTFAPLIAALNPAAEGADHNNRLLRLNQMIDRADFGKLRKTVTDGADQLYPLAEALAERIVSDPVAFANLLNIFPPLLNNFLKVTAHAVQKIDFPPEILASAVFNFLDDLELQELGKTITSLCILLNELHRGSAILGGNQPRFRDVLQRAADKIVSDLDPDQSAAALVTLGEDLEVFLNIAAETAASRPELFRALGLAFLQGLSASFRGLAQLLEEPGLKDLRFTLLREGTQLIRESGLSDFINPEKLAALSNFLIATYNRRPEASHHPGDDALGIYFQNLDQEELSQALLNASDSLATALAGNPALARSSFKAVGKILFGTLRGLLRRRPKTRGKIYSG